MSAIVYMSIPRAYPTAESVSSLLDVFRYHK